MKVLQKSPISPDRAFECNFLRAPLGSTTYTLTSSYGSRPHFFVHHMALGETIGFTTRLTQNNAGGYEPVGIGSRLVHTALHGDPTLRMHPVIPLDWKTPVRLDGAAGGCMGRAKAPWLRL